jgi:hypothetical protein
MPEGARRTICRSIFLLFGLLPLIGSFGWGTWQYLTWDAEACRTWLAGQLGLDVRLSQVVHPRPGVTRLESVNIVDPETEQLVARCQSLEVRQSAAGIGIHCPAAKLPPDQFCRLLELLHERLLRQKRLLAKSVRLIIDEVSLPGSGRELHLSEFRLQADLAAPGPAAELHFRWTHRPDSEPVRLYLLRDQRRQPPVTTVHLQTGETPLPCTVFCRRFPFGSNLDDEVTFQGNLVWQASHESWSADLTGRIDNLRLEDDRLATADPTAPPAAISGPVSLLIRRAVVRDSWMQVFEGQLQAGPGRISRRLLAAAQQHLSMQVGSLPGRETATEPVDYEALGVLFQISSDRAVLRGLCPESDAGVIACSAAGPLLREADDPTHTTVALYRTLLNLPASHVPIAAARRTWLGLLPLPH